MCGIVGIISRGRPVDAGLLRDATDSLAHRGPDDSGHVILQGHGPAPIEVGLGHRRLAILDLSQFGHQPMHDPGTGNWIVFNGEIYNFRDLRRKLESKGFAFQSRSDTEVLLKAYALWGNGCVHHLRGIFAFALWDARNTSLFLARDPLGVKPLYYSAQGEYFLFASELRTLLRTGLVPRKLDPAGLFSYLSFGSVYEPNTAITGISALPAGHCLTWNAGRVTVKRYWSAPALTASLNAQEANDQVADVVEESIRLQTVSDVPVGVFLSGGIDSSAITAVLSRSQRPTTFSVVFREKEFNEGSLSRAVAQRLRTDHHEVLCTAEEGMELSQKAIAAMDQPTIDGINTYLICGVARKTGIKVVLSGLGGDELFCGYRTFHSVPRMEIFHRLWKRVPAQSRIGDWLLSQYRGSDGHHKLHALATENGHLIHPYFLARALFTPAQARVLLKRVTNDGALSQLRDVFLDTVRMDPINRVSYLESRCYMLNTLLRDSDVMSMAHGMELRVPLIDPQLAEKLFLISGRLKMRRGVPKPLLVNAVRSELPDEVVYRKKQGFTFPFDQWLRNEMRDEVQRSVTGIEDGPLASSISAESATRVWDDFHSGRTSWSRPWSLHVLQRWCAHNHVQAV